MCSQQGCTAWKGLGVKGSRTSQVLSYSCENCVTSPASPVITQRVRNRLGCTHSHRRGSDSSASAVIVQVLQLLGSPRMPCGTTTIACSSIHMTTHHWFIKQSEAEGQKCSALRLAVNQVSCREQCSWYEIVRERERERARSAAQSNAFQPMPIYPLVFAQQSVDLILGVVAASQSCGGSSGDFRPKLILVSLHDKSHLTCMCPQEVNIKLQTKIFFFQEKKTPPPLFQ